MRDQSIHWIGKVKSRAIRVGRCIRRHTVLAAVALLLTALVSPSKIQGQLPSPCCAVLAVGLGTINSTLGSVIGGGLQSINTVLSDISHFEQTVIWPRQAITQALGMAGQIQGFYAQIRAIFTIPISSATLQNPKQLESILLSRNPGQIPEDSSISSLSTRRGLVIRYPIRMKEDLLPIQILTFEDTALLLEQVLRGIGCGMDSTKIPDLVGRQLRLPGTFSLHSKTAERDGGDFDFDLVAVLQDSEFPRFVQSRFDMSEGYQKKKDKKTKIKSPWWNLADVAMKARGNQIGRITNLISDCIAAGRNDKAYELVDQLQNALDSLKHNVQVDQDVIKQIRSMVPKAAWLATKEARRISDMPMEVSIGSLDIVGQLYNHVRKEIGILFQDVYPLRDFGGMIRGETFDRDMYEECRKINKTFGTLVGVLRKRTEKCQTSAGEAQAKFDAVRDHNSADVRRKASKALYRAKAALRDNEERCREEMRDFHRFLAEWGNGKRENRRGWCQALHSIATGSKSAQEGKATGAIVFHAFPQEALDKLLEETGGRPIQLQLPELPDGEIVFDDSGNVYRVERIQLEGGQIQERRLFLFRMTDHGDIILDGVRVDSVQPFAMQEGSGEIRNGMVTFSNVPQHPTVRARKARVLRSREDRQEFLTSCEKTLGPSFSVFVDGDPRSIRQLDTETKKQAFLERAPVRPWESRPFQGTAVQQ